MNAVYTDYADALFALARETGQDLSDDLLTVQQVFRDNPAYTELLSSPGIPLAERTAAIRQAIGEVVSPTVCSFVQLLCEHGHVKALSACIDDYMEQYRAARHLSVAEVVSAVPLTEEEQAALTRKLTAMSGRTVTLQCTVDPSLLGGVVVRMDGKVLDGSVKRRLRDMKEVINT